tara:strand:+ start:914 stop:1432 length:519 start_codon:yes stop_codon:yes gene_type:complete
MDDIRIKIHNFIKPYEAEILMRYWDKNQRLCTDFSPGHAERSLHVVNISNTQIKEILKYITSKGCFFVDHFFNTKCYPFQDPILCRWKEGHHMSFHIDQKKDVSDGRKDLMNYSSILYLNDNYEGGELVFKDGERYKPQALDFVMFDSGPKNEHSVDIIKSGFRYTIPLWYN